MPNVKKNIRSTLTQQGQEDGYWVRKFNTLIIGGNGAALVLLGSFMNKAGNPIEQLQENRLYFLPFLFGILLAGLATVFGARAERTIVSLKLTIEEGNELGITQQLPPGEYKRDAETKYYSAKYSFERWLSLFHLTSGLCFIGGVFSIAFL